VPPTADKARGVLVRKEAVATPVTVGDSMAFARGEVRAALQKGVPRADLSELHEGAETGLKSAIDS